MTLVVTHAKVNTVADSTGDIDAGGVLASDWNTNHTIAGTAGATQLSTLVPLAVTNDTNVTGALDSQTLTLGWTGTLAAGRLNSNVVQSVVNDTNVTGSIAAQALTLGWTGTLGLSRLTHGSTGQVIIQGVTDPAYQTVSGDATLSSSGGLTVANSAISNAKQANMAAWTLKMNNSGSAAAPQDVTIDSLTSKASPVGADEVAIWDVAGAAMKKATLTAAIGAASVTSFNSRTGAVVPATGDYTESQVYGGHWFGHRCTLTTATPVLAANTTAQGTIYLTPYLHDLISLYDGTRFQTTELAEKSITLDATNFLSGKVYDLFVAWNSGTPFFGYGPAWTNTTTRSAAITRVQGVWTNNASITLRSASGTTNTAAANTALLVGTVYATANAQTGCAYDASGAGGGNTIWGVFNVYNRVPIIIRSRDTTADWTYATATWRAADNSANNAVNFVDGLGDVNMNAYTEVRTDATASVPVNCTIGINLNSTSATPTIQAINRIRSSTGNAVSLAATGAFLPTLGFNTLTAMELGDTNTSDFSGGATQWIHVEVMV